jgi:tetratricopeptide (TPR) repeat protein
LAAALSATAVCVPANAMGIETPQSGSGGGMQLQSADPAQPKVPSGKKKKKAPDRKSESLFIDGYRLAYDAIYNRQDYAGAIAILSALGRDDHPDVANLIGFASRKLGRTEDAKVWYEKALAADSNHARTWQYYGMWYLERGDRPMAEQHLERIRLICGQGCEEYTSLREALDGKLTY